MIKPLILATSLVFAAVSSASAQGYSYWQGEACGNGGISDSKCEQAFARLCGRTPNAACVARHQKTFSASSSFKR